MPTQRRKEKRVEEGASVLGGGGRGEGEGEKEKEHAGGGGERERERNLPPPFICFSLPLGLPYANWASQECCLFYLKSSLQSSTFLCSVFAGFSLPCLLASAILDSCFLF